MLYGFLTFKDPLIFVNNNIIINTEFKEIFIQDDEWAIIEELLRIFQVFYKPTVRLQGEAYITLSNTLLDIYSIFKKLNALKSEYNRRQRSSVSLIFLPYFLTFLILLVI